MRKLWFHLQTADSNEQVQRSLKPERSSQIMTHVPLQAQELMRQDRVEEFLGLQVETQGVITGEKISVLVACSVHNLPTFDWHQVKERRKSDEGSNINQRKSPQVKNLPRNQFGKHLFQVSGKKPKKSPYVSPGKGVPCPECNKEFRNQAVLDRSSSFF